MRVLFVVMAAGLIFARGALAADVYLVRGPQGEASFSDFALPRAVAVQLDVQQPSPLEAQAARERMVATLAIAGELEAARLSREKLLAEQKAERKAKAAKRAAQQVPKYVQPEVRRVVSFPYGNYPYRKKHHEYPRPHTLPHEPRDRTMEPRQPRRTRSRTSQLGSP